MSISAPSSTPSALPEGYFFCPSVEPPADQDGYREKRLSQIDATIFTFKNYRSSGDALNRWLYCRVLDNTCRVLGISPDMTDVRIVEALRARRLPFGKDLTEFDFFDGQTRYTLLPGNHPVADVAEVVGFYAEYLKRYNMLSNQASTDAGCDAFDEMGITAMAKDWYAYSEGLEHAEVRETILAHLQSMPTEVIEGANRARAFFARLLACLVVAAYLERFSGRTASVLDTTTK